MKRWIFLAVVGLCSVVAAFAQNGQGFTATVNVGGALGTVQNPDVYAAGDEVIFRFEYDARGDYGFSLFDPPNGKGFMILQKAGIARGQGTLTVAVAAEKLKGVGEVTCLIDPSGQRGFVFFRLSDGVAGLRRSAIPANVSAQVIRAGSPQVTRASDDPVPAVRAATAPYSVRAQVPKAMAEIGPAEMIYTGTEVVFIIPYDSTGTWSADFADQPEGKTLNIRAFGAMKPGKGTLAFAVAPERLAGVGEVSVTLFRGDLGGYVVFRLDQDPQTLKPTPLPTELADKVFRMSPKTAVQDPNSPYLMEMPEQLATMGTPSAYSTGKEVIFVFPYESRGTWDVSFGNPSKGFSMAANSAMKKGKGELVFGVPTTTLGKLGQIFVMVRTPRLGGDVTVELGKLLPTLPVTKVPAERASQVIRASTKQPRSYDKPVLTPEQARWTAFDDLPATKEGAANLVGKNLDARLVGRWSDGFTEAQMVFYPDGTAMSIAPYSVVQDKILWATRGDKVLIQTNNSEGADGKPHELPYTIKDGHLLFDVVSTSISGEKEKIVHGYVPYP